MNDRCRGALIALRYASLIMSGQEFVVIDICPGASTQVVDDMSSDHV